jgi:hypothetical protein
MCFDLADQRRPHGSGGGGRAVKDGGEGSSGAAAGSAMTMAELMSGYYQAQEMSTMVSALSRVVAEDDPWAAEAYQWAAPATTSSGGMGLEEQAMRGGGGGGYVHELGSYPGAPSSEFAGNSQHTHAVVACSSRALHALLLPLLAFHIAPPSFRVLFFIFCPFGILAWYSISKRGATGQHVSANLIIIRR